jgi:hypothetical protein
MKLLRVFSRELTHGFTERTTLLNAIVILAAIFAVFLQGYYFRVADNDLFARLAVGRLVGATGEVPLQDLFAFTQTKSRWIDHEWLSGVIFASVDEIGGDLGLFLVNISLGALTVLLIRRAQLANGGEGIFGPVCLLLVVFPISFIWNSTIRSQVFTFLYFSFLLLALSEFRRRNIFKYLAAMPLLFILWGNSHGGFVVGLGFIAITLAVAIFKNVQKAVILTVILSLSIAALFVNPYGLEYLRFIFEAVTLPRPDISEWSQTPLTLQYAIFWFFGLITVVFACFGRYRRQISLEGWLLLGVSLFFASQHVRHLPFFLLTAVIYLPPLFENFYKNAKRWSRERIIAAIRAMVFVSLLIILGGSLALGQLLLRGGDFSLNYAGYPVRTVDWLKQNRAGGNILAHFDISSFVLYKLGPQFKVAIDGRYEEVYPQETFDKALLALRPDLPGFTEAFTSINPDLIILCEPTTPIEWANKFPGEWGTLFYDSTEGCLILGK